MYKPWVEVFATSWIEITHIRITADITKVEVFATSWIEMMYRVIQGAPAESRGLCDLVD